MNINIDSKLNNTRKIKDQTYVLDKFVGQNIFQYYLPPPPNLKIYFLKSTSDVLAHLVLNIY